MLEISLSKVTTYLSFSLPLQRQKETAAMRLFNSTLSILYKNKIHYFHNWGAAALL